MFLQKKCVVSYRDRENILLDKEVFYIGTARVVEASTG